MTPEQPEPADGGQGAAPAPPLGWSMPGDPPAPAEGASVPEPATVTLYAVPPVGTLTVPPLEDGGDTVIITRHGTKVTGDVAARAHHAAALAGVTLREE